MEIYLLSTWLLVIALLPLAALLYKIRQGAVPTDRFEKAMQTAIKKTLSRFPIFLPVTIIGFVQINIASKATPEFYRSLESLPFDIWGMVAATTAFYVAYPVIELSIATWHHIRSSSDPGVIDVKDGSDY